jgi:hypothetical protein
MLNFPSDAVFFAGGKPLLDLYGPPPTGSILHAINQVMYT